MLVHILIVQKIKDTCARSGYRDIRLRLVHVLIILICLQCVHVLGIECMYMLLVHVSLLYEFTLVHALLIFLFMLHTLIFLLIHSNTFMFSLKYYYSIYMCVFCWLILPTRAA